MEIRDKPNDILQDADGAQVGPTGFFAQGFHSAINWDQVARQQQLWAANAARLSTGPVAYQNSARQGTPLVVNWAFPRYACKSLAGAEPGPVTRPVDASAFFFCIRRVLLDRLPLYMQSVGQLLYYVQAVDIPHQAAYKNTEDVYVQALAVANMSTKTCGLMSFCPLFIGMRMKLTKKIMAPEMVQEAGGEVVGVAFHEQEAFGRGITNTAPLAPPPDHPCWAQGYVLLDRLPRYLEFRLDRANADYTGLGKPGVWHLEPTHDEWTLEYKLHYRVQHPKGRAVIKTKNVQNIQMTRCQIPAAPERVGTYQNFQGKTVRGPQGEPLGHTIDLRKPDYMHDDEYKQHLYICLLYTSDAADE